MMITLEEIYPDIYRLEIPLPNNPLRSLNSYVIKSEGSSLIIDTGFNSDECRKAFMEGMEKLGIDLGAAELLITHLHSDHCGLAAAIKGRGAAVYAGEADGRTINEMAGLQYWNKFDSYKRVLDLEKDGVSFDDHPGYRYCPKEPVEFIALREGDRLDIGRYSFKVVDIPGHTPGHIGLYEEKHRLFFCGDHILDRITPNITFWGFEQDILAVYFESLRKVYDYEIDYLLTAHRSIVRDHRRRIAELFEHHRKRLKEIEEIISHKPVSVRDTAAAMHWELKYSSWEEFPNPQKWFAAGEAMSHLEHLYLTGKADRISIDGILYYKLKAVNIRKGE